jgi:2-methylcitrate dehydratase PrpD
MDPAARRLATFAVSARPTALGRARAAAAVLDTIGVTLAGASEPVARIVQQIVSRAIGGSCRILGAERSGSAADAAYANGTAAHALDFDDMCFVSLAHPSAVLVPAALAAAEDAGASGATLLDAYVVGFEIEARLGRAMNPAHYRRGWHCTSTIGVIGASAAAGRLFGLDVDAMTHAIAIAASSSSGLKENFGTMVKPLHAGMAARDGVTAALLASRGLTGSVTAIDGPQGLLHAMDGQSSSLDAQLADLGTRWEIDDTGITVKLYPSCAGTHPALDAILDVRRAHGLTHTKVTRVEVGVDATTPTILIYDRPTTGLEGKFSMPFCAAAALVFGRIGIDTFEPVCLADARVQAVMARTFMRVDDTLDASAPPLTRARVRITLEDGRHIEQDANGARGYPERPASADELAGKFLSCAARAMPRERAERARQAIAGIATAASVRDVIDSL